MLLGAGFVVDRVDQASDAETGEVIGQNPAANTTVNAGTTVTVTVSTGPETASVPNVLGETEAAAIGRLADAGFRTTTLRQEVFDPVQDGIVLAQDPGGGTELEQGSAITITVGTLAGTPTTPTTPTTPSQVPPDDDVDVQ
jgi:serine/threonine-protein kinase